MREAQDAVIGLKDDSGLDRRRQGDFPVHLMVLGLSTVHHAGTAMGLCRRGFSPGILREWLALLLAVLPVTVSPPAYAQLADVVTPDEEGNFDSSSVQGARGFYPQKQWLVVDRGSGGLRCRDVNGTMLVGLRYGSVIDTDLSSTGANPITLEKGKPWLRVRVTPADFQADYRDRSFLNQPAICRVRAQVNYLAPINPDTLAP